jgi:uncharacterized membrane protein YedE/YeeE
MSFSPLEAVLGGALIGLASAGLLLANGRIAGISGILGRSFFAEQGDFSWRVAFLVGLPIGALVALRATGDSTGFVITDDPVLLVASGLLVGVGTQVGSGCTSGHGVCGMARGSRRSIVVFVAAMLVGVVGHRLFTLVRPPTAESPLV